LPACPRPASFPAKAIWSESSGARVTVETRDAAHAEEILSALATDGYQPARIETGATME
jgi:hypothetical protein